VSTPFDTSLRRDPSDPRNLLERIDAVVRERIEEAVEFGCLDLLVHLRRSQARPLPARDNPGDRQEFEALVRDFLRALRDSLLADLADGAARKTRDTEEAGGAQELAHLLGGQAALARLLPDYWQRFESFREGFVRERLAAPPPRPGLLDRLLGRS
jgi:hypothetical protein